MLVCRNCYTTKATFAFITLNFFRDLLDTLSIPFSLARATHWQAGTRVGFWQGGDIRVFKEKPFACLDCGIAISWETSCYIYNAIL